MRQILILSFLLHASFAWSQWLPRAGNSTSIKQLNEFVSMARRAGVVSPYQSIYLVGGSATSVLNHIISGEPIKMRDFDLAFVDPKISQLKAIKMSRDLESLGKSKEKMIEPKTWASGWGIFHNVLSEDLILDLIIYSDEAGLFEKGGVINTERVKLEIPPRKDLTFVARKLHKRWLRSGTIEDFLQDPLIIDQEGGFISLKAKSPRIIRAEEVRLTPLTASMRIVRTFAKLGAALSLADQDLIEESLDLMDAKIIEAKTFRQFSYLLGDPSFATQLKALQELGLFKRFLPSMDRFLARSTVASLQKTLYITEARGSLDRESQIVERLGKLGAKLSLADRLQLTENLESFYGAKNIGPKIVSCRTLF